MGTTNCGCQSDAVPADVDSNTTTNPSAKMVVYINSATLGIGDDDLGTTLMGVYLDTLANFAAEISHVILINSGVKLACRDSTGTEPLLNLANTGIKVLSCGTCLNYFDLLDKKQVGETTNMLDIVTAMQLADKVINV